MIKLTENNLMGRAYMLDKNDNLIEVKYHPYGYEGDIEENTSCLYFLYKYGEKLKDKIEDMIFEYLIYCFNNSIDNIWTDDIDNIELDKQNFKQVFNDNDMYNVIAGWAINISRNEVFNDLYNIFIEGLEKYNLNSALDINNYEIYADNVEGYMALNEDYVRVRVGGRYDNDREDCIYFRISSIGYDWGDNIMDIVFKKFSNIGYITIERDMESAKLNKTNHRIYKTRDGQPINHLPIKDFIYQEHIPLVASLDKKVNKNIEFELLPLIESRHSMLEVRKYLPKSVMLTEYKYIIKEQLKSLKE